MYVMDNNMYDFAFVVVAYNQEKYVRQHLESIKYQIEHYGHDLKIQIIFSDDCSQDNTVEIARDWISDNKVLFQKTEIVIHDVNVGTIRNMCESISAVESKSYKVLACDDLYYKNNIFELSNNYDIVLTPTISFWNDGRIDNELSPDYCQILRLKEDNMKSGIGKMLKYNQCIPSPGVFMSIKFWKDPELINYIMQYKYIEDIPEWDYIFNKEVDYAFKVIAVNKPYILYRREVGVSTKIDHKSANPIDKEYKKIRDNIPAKEDIKPKWLNYYRYKHYLETHLINKLWLVKCRNENKLASWDEAIINVREYLSFILSK